jgi:2-methylcitrate dehydratase PrpD
MNKPLHAGHAAEAGLLAAIAASGGFTGALDVLEGAIGFGVAMSDSPDWTAAVTEPDRQLAVERITVKNHSCCGHTFAAVDAALLLRARGIDLDDVTSIEVSTYTTATEVAGYRNPRSEFEAKFSTSYCVSAALVLGSVRLRAFEPAALQDQDIRDLEAKVTVVADERMEQAFPGQRQARVTITDGRGRVHTELRNTRKGDPDDPMTDAELHEKFTDLVEPVLGADATTRLAKVLWRTAQLGRIREIPLAPAASSTPTP